MAEFDFSGSFVNEDMGLYCLRCEDLMFDAWVDNKENGEERNNEDCE